MSFEELAHILRTCDISETAVITPESRLREDLTLSSFQMMVLIIKLEKALRKEIDPVALTNSITVQELLSSLNTLDTSM